jgi:hypothetical protein
VNVGPQLVPGRVWCLPFVITDITAFHGPIRVQLVTAAYPLWLLSLVALGMGALLHLPARHRAARRRRRRRRRRWDHHRRWWTWARYYMYRDFEFGRLQPNWRLGGHCAVSDQGRCAVLDKLAVLIFKDLSCFLG